MNSKKGTIEVQFNWMFVLIIGAIILLLFTGVILRQKNISETSRNVLVLNNLDAILSSSEVSPGTTNILKIPQSSIEFKCNRYSIGRLSNQLELMNVFAPYVLNGDRIISMTLDWSVPYKVTNIVYLTNPDYRYIFIGNDKVAAEIKNMMPNASFSESFSALGNVRYKRENKVRFIFFDGSIEDGNVIPDSLEDYIKIPDRDVTALKVSGTSELGEVEFYEKRNNRFKRVGNSYYLGKEALLGAVFSDNLETYDCAMISLFQKLDIVTRIYRDKTKKISEIYDQDNHRCEDIIDTAYTLQNLNQILSASLRFSYDNSKKIIGFGKNLESQNKIAQLQSCATIY